MKINPLVTTFCAVLLLLVTSCKKSNDITPDPNSKIVSYIVHLPEVDLHGVVDDTENTITLYVPLQYGLTFIEPTITLAPGASVNNAPQRIDVLNDKISYTVTGADKSVTTYKLIIVVQQKKPLLVDELSEDNIKKINIGSIININGNFDRTLFNEVKMTLVAADGTETLLVNGSDYVSTEIKDNGTIFYSIERQMPVEMQPGIYKVRIKYLKLSLEMKNPIELVFGRPGWLLGTKIVNQGGTFTIDRSHNSVFKNFSEFSIMVNGVKTLLPILSYNLNQATIQVPETVPTGEYIPTAVFDGFPPKVGVSKIVVTPKNSN